MHFEFCSGFDFEIKPPETERRTIVIESVGAPGLIKIRVDMPYCHDLPLHFHGIAIRHAYPREIEELRPKIPKPFPHEGTQFFIIEDGARNRYFLNCEFLLIEV